MKAAEEMQHPLNQDEAEEIQVVADVPIAIANNYESIPVLEQTKLPRGGVSVETQAVGRVQVRFMLVEFYLI